MSGTRLAYLLKKFPRLSETFILNEILGQTDLGRSLTIFSRRPPDEEVRHPQLARLQARVEVLPSRRRLDPWEVLFSETTGSVELFTHVGEVVRTGRQWHHPRLPELIVEALHLWKRTAELGVEHIHTHFATDSAVVAMILHDLGGPTYSVTAHAKDIYRNTVDPQLLTRMFERSEFVVTVCDANVDYLASRVSSRALQRVRRLYNGIDLSAFQPFAGGREPAHILSVGRLVEKKGFSVLVEALARLRSEGVAFQASIVGEGDQQAALEEMIADLGLETQVCLLGARNQSEVRKLMQRATLLCQPCLIGSDGNRDALPTVLLEALACGLPAVSTPVTGIPEILDRGRAGVLVPEKDPEATARALADLLHQPERRRRLAAAGHERAHELFDGKRSAQTLGRWLDACLDVERESCVSPV